jgi:phosphatidylinositol alpha-1,6-mannosyltransferase
MRVLMLNNEFPPLGGGTGTVNRAILQRLEAHPEVEIDLVTSALGRRYEEEHFAEHIRLLKVPVNNHNIHHSSNRELFTYAMRGLALAWNLQRRKPYHLCMAWAGVPAGSVALILHHLCSLQYLLRVSGPDIPGFEQRYSLLYPVLTPIIRAVWRGAERVIAKCQEEAVMIQRCEPGLPVEIVPNGVDLVAFPPAPGAPNDGPLRLLCVARLIERKGQRQLISAVQRLSADGLDVTLELVGDGDSLETYQKLAGQLGVQERVTFCGYIPREEIAAHYTSAHVFVLPSYNEGMSVAMLEAMAAGLPLVCTHTGGASELVQEHGPTVNGFTYTWGDLDALTAILRRLALDRSMSRRMGAASRQYAANFTWESASQKILELLENAVSR